MVKFNISTGKNKGNIEMFFKHIIFSVCCRTEINDNVIMNPCVRTVHSLVKKTTVLVREMYLNEFFRLYSDKVYA